MEPSAEYLPVYDLAFPRNIGSTVDLTGSVREFPTCNLLAEIGIPTTFSNYMHNELIVNFIS